MIIQSVLTHARAQLQMSSSARLDAQLLLCAVLGVDKHHLIMYPEQELTPQQYADFTALLARRIAGEPIAYLLGEKGFWDLDFIVTLAVLIPRPETEHLIEAALKWCQGRSEIIAADIGTGSGAIAVTVAKHAVQIRTMHAVDISPDALAIARQNANRHSVPITFHQGSLAQPLLDQHIKLDLLLANLPYIATADMQTLAVSQHEPHLALDGGEDGLDLVRELLRQVPQLCHVGALILLEIGSGQGQAVIDAATVLPLTRAEIIYDYAGHDRIVALQL